MLISQLHLIMSPINYRRGSRSRQCKKNTSNWITHQISRNLFYYYNYWSFINPLKLKSYKYYSIKGNTRPYNEQYRGTYLQRAVRLPKTMSNDEIDNQADILFDTIDLLFYNKDPCVNICVDAREFGAYYTIVVTVFRRQFGHLI